MQGGFEKGKELNSPEQLLELSLPCEHDPQFSPNQKSEEPGLLRGNKSLAHLAFMGVYTVAALIPMAVDSRGREPTKGLRGLPGP